MTLSAADQTRFPIATDYIKKVLPTVINNPVIVRAMHKTGQLNRARFRDALSWGTAPAIQIVVGIPACAQFSPTPGNTTIEIRESIFQDYEAGLGMLVTRAGTVPALGLNILHEMVHWGDNLDGIDRAGEEGNEFENLVYGQDLGC